MFENMLALMERLLRNLATLGSKLEEVFKENKYYFLAAISVPIVSFVNRTCNYPFAIYWSQYSIGSMVLNYKLGKLSHQLRTSKSCLKPDSSVILVSRPLIDNYIICKFGSLH